MNSETLEKAISLAFELKQMIIDDANFQYQIEQFEYLTEMNGTLTTSQQKELGRVERMQQYRKAKSKWIIEQLNVIRKEVAQND